MPQTIRLHRVLRTTPDKAYKAFLDAGALAKWLPPFGFTCQVHHLEPKVGGGFRMSFTNFGTGHSHSFAAPTSNWSPASACATTTSLTTPICPAR